MKILGINSVDNVDIDNRCLKEITLHASLTDEESRKIFFMKPDFINNYLIEKIKDYFVNLDKNEHKEEKQRQDMLDSLSYVVEYFVSKHKE